jgi:two-component system nitrate/nitrite response regulator NarP
LSHGYSNRKIAGKLEISDNTVKFHLKNIYEKILVDNRTQAAAFYNQLQKEKL